MHQCPWGDVQNASGIWHRLSSTGHHDSLCRLLELQQHAEHAPIPPTAPTLLWGPACLTAGQGIRLFWSSASGPLAKVTHVSCAGAVLCAWHSAQLQHGQGLQGAGQGSSHAGGGPLQPHAGCWRWSQDCTVPLGCCDTHPSVVLNEEEAAMFCVLADCRLPGVSGATSSLEQQSRSRTCSAASCFSLLLI